MRVLRVVAGITVLLLALPVLAAGAVAWWAMQHRSPDGAFHASMMSIDAPGRVLVVADVDAILRRDAPIARADKTTLRLSSPGFIGMAEPGDVAAYLARVDYTAVEGVSLARGPLPVRTRNVTANGDQLSNPQEQDFWVRGGAGELSWTPSVDRGRQLALVIVAPAGPEPVRLNVSVTAGWLGSTTWGLLILGPVLLLLGFAALAWPQRPREIIYVMDGSAASAAALPALASGRTVVHVPPQQQQSAAPVPPPPPVPQLAWPPTEPLDDTHAPRELPMPVAGVHPHLTNRS
ncbi:MAG TPA: hypothetical protein VF062_02585 [Candidatus Limnocylindrales bacterium]